GHLLETGQLTELTLERRGDGRRHHVGAGAGVEREDLDGRVVHLGEGGDRELKVRDASDEEDGGGEQRGRDGTEDEDPRGIHRGAVGRRGGARVAAFSGEFWGAR